MSPFTLAPQSEKDEEKQEYREASEPVAQLRGMAIEADTFAMYMGMGGFLCVRKLFHELFLNKFTAFFQGKTAV